LSTKKVAKCASFLEAANDAARLLATTSQPCSDPGEHAAHNAERRYQRMREFHRRQPTPCGNAAPARPRLVAYSSRRKRPGGSQGEQGSRRDLVVPSTIRSTALRRSAAERLLVVTDTRPSHPLRGDLSSHLAREACSRRPSHQSGCPSCSFRNRSYRDRPTVSNVTVGHSLYKPDPEEAVDGGRRRPTCPGRRSCPRSCRSELQGTGDSPH
jgi:hypothetical protein